MLEGDWLEQERSGYDVGRESTGDDSHVTVRLQALCNKLWVDIDEIFKWSKMDREIFCKIISLIWPPLWWVRRQLPSTPI